MAIQKAIEPIQKAKAAKSLSYRYFLQEGDRAFQQHLDPAEAENLLNEALNAYSQAQEQAPEAPEVLIRMAKVFHLQSHTEKAERYLRKVFNALAKGQVDKQVQQYVQREAYLLQGIIQAHRGEHGSSVKTLIKSIQLSGFQSSRARWEIFRSCQSMVLDSSPSKILGLLPFSAIGAYSLLTSLAGLPFQRENNSWVHNLLVIPQMCLSWFHEETGAVDKALHRYLDLHHVLPGLGSISVMIGCAYRSKGQMEQAKYWLEAAIERHPTDLNAHYQLAQLHEYQENYTEMATTYRKMTKLRSGNPHIWCNLANALYYGKHYQEALSCYETALRLGTDSRWKAMVAQSIANIYADFLQNTETAKAYYQMAQQLDPSDVENYIQLGLLYFQKEDYDNAERIYQTANKMTPDNPRLYSNLGYLRWMAGDIETAIRLYNKAITLDNNYEIPLNNLGVIHLDTLGQVQKAIELFKQAIAINENYALAQYNLGRAYSFLNQRMEAATCFRIAQDINQFSKELDNDELTARINNLFDTYEMEFRGE